MERETDGVKMLGEVPLVIRRDSSVESDHLPAYRSGRESALSETLAYAEKEIACTPQYEDTRPMTRLVTFLRDKIKETADGAA